MAPFFWAFLVVVSTLLCGHSVVEATYQSIEEAFNESQQINYNELYNGALFHLDMEDQDNVTTKLNLPWKYTLQVTSEENCSDIIQHLGIPWADGNNSMKFNSSGSNVRVNGTADITAGISVSLWVRKFDNPGNRNCSIGTVELNGQKFELSKNYTTNQDMDEYRLIHGSDRSLLLELDKTWDWNMISITINQTNVCVSENGVYLEDLSGSAGVPICDDSPFGEDTFDDKDKAAVSVSLNNPHGCKGVEVDQVAMWDRVLNMSELIALRVQPFNSSCQLDFTTQETAFSTIATTLAPKGDYDVDKKLETLADAEPAEASDILQDIGNATSADDLLHSEDIANLTNILRLSASQGLLNDSTLDEATQQNNRKAFIEIGNFIVETASEDEGVAELVQVNELVEGMEDTLSGVYFYSDIANETITTSSIYLSYVTFSEDHKDFDKVIPLPQTNIIVTIPAENFIGDEQEVLVMVYHQDINPLVADGTSGILTELMSLQLPATKGKKLTSNIDITFTVTEEALNRYAQNKSVIPTCHYLNLESSMWLKDGVKTHRHVDEEGKETSEITCQVSHLTNFAVLMSRVELEDNATLSTLSYVLLSISIICLLITFVVLTCLREIGNTQRVQILKQFIFALMIAQLLFVTTSEHLADIEVACIIAASLSHYFWLAAFTWMLVQGVQLYTKVRRLVGGNIKQLFYVLFAWGFPLPVALVPLIINFTSGTKLPICWIPVDLIWFFAVPVVLVFMVNLMVTVMVMKTFLTVKVNKDKTDAEKLKSSLRAVIVMVPVLGLTWAFGFFLLISPEVLLFQYLFVILNALQGVAVFLLHLVLNEDVRSALLKRRNKVAASAENTIFTKLPRNRNSEHSGGIPTDTSKAPLPSDSTNM
ncbi:uncharacterized protein [Apostichopus japonicus]|uniref:uncharacterized protein n=1 Tax=Stichopus japonicus TaxID=307972 RepID=UPI003AB7359E